MSNVNLIFFDLDSKKNLISELKDYYKNKEEIEITSLNDVSEVNSFIKQTGNAVLLFKIVSKDDLTNAVTILKAQANLIKKGLFKPACIMQVSNKKLEKILLKYGCNELLDSEMRSKTMAYKIDFWTKNLVTVLKKAQNAQELKLKIKQEESAGEAAANNKVGTISVPALKLKSDIWIVKNKLDCKKILKRWLIRVLGPGPTVGKWVEVETKNTKKYQLWEFQLNEEGEKFIYEPGTWFFAGAKPEFDWKANRWILTGEYVHLYFYTEAKETLSRFKLDVNQLQVAENSKFALAKEEKILLTCDKKFEFSNDEEVKEESSHLEGDAKNEEKNSSLEGEFSHDAIDTSPMKGKGEASDEIEGHLKGRVSKNSEENEDENSESGFSEDDIEKYYNSKTKGGNEEDSGPLRGDVDTSANAKKKNGDNTSDFKEDEIETHYGGKGKTDHVDDSPLSGKLSKNSKGSTQDHESEFEEDAIETHYGGKGKTDHVDDSPLSGKLSKNSKDSQQDHESEFEEDAIETHYGGKSKTDHVDDSPLSGKVTKNGKNSKKDHESEFEEDAIKKHYGGKSKTDHVDDSPLSGKVAKNTKDAKKDKRTEFEEEAIETHYEGNGDNDLEGHDPLSGKIGQKKNIAKAARKSNFAEDEIESNYDGDSETDNIDDDPISGKLKAKAQKQKENKKNNYNEDAIGSHYSGKIDTSLSDDEEEDEDDPLLASIKKKKAKPGQQAKSTSTNDVDVLDENGNDDDDDSFDPLIGASKKKNSKSKEVSISDGTKEDIELFDDEADSHEADKTKKEKKSKPVRAAGIPDFDPLADNDIDEDDAGNLNDIVIGQKKKMDHEDDPLGLSTIIDNKKKTANLNKKDNQHDDDLKIKKKNLNKSPEEEIDEVLSGDLTKNSKKAKENLKNKTSQLESEDEEDDSEEPKNKLDFNKKIGKQNQTTDNKPDLNKIIGEAPKVNLESGEVRVLLEQETGQGNKISFACKFDDLFENELVVLAPKNSLVADTEVLVTMALRYNSKKALVKSKGKITVVDVNDSDNDCDILTVVLTEVDKAKITGFMTLYAERQESIDEFMTLAKGY